MLMNVLSFKEAISALQVSGSRIDNLTEVCVRMTLPAD